VPVSAATPRGPVELRLHFASGGEWAIEPAALRGSLASGAAFLGNLSWTQSGMVSNLVSRGMPCDGNGGPCRLVIVSARPPGTVGGRGEAFELAGESYGLPLTLAMAVQALDLLVELLDPDGELGVVWKPSLAATGRIYVGEVREVRDLNEKLDALAAAGFSGLLLVPNQEHRVPHGLSPERVDTLGKALDRIFESWLAAYEERIGALVAPLANDGVGSLRSRSESWACPRRSAFHASAYLDLVVKPARNLLARAERIPLGTSHPGEVLKAALDWVGQSLGERVDACLMRLAAWRYADEASSSSPSSWPSPSADPLVTQLLTRDWQSAAGVPAAARRILDATLGAAGIEALLACLEQPDVLTSSQACRALDILAAPDSVAELRGFEDRIRHLVLLHATSDSGQVLAALVGLIEVAPLPEAVRFRALMDGCGVARPDCRGLFVTALARAARRREEREEFDRLCDHLIEEVPTPAVRRAIDAARQRAHAH
jgi:hypothetical protein